MSSTEVDFSDGTLTYREYVVVLSGGSRVTLAITLGDPDADGIAAEFAREKGALAHGLVSFMGLRDGPEFPIVWMVNASELTLAKATDDREVSNSLVELIAHYLG